MAENIAADILAPVVQDGVKWVGATIKRQFNYLCCFTSNIANLKLEVEELQEQVERARDNVQVISREVEAWLIKSNDINDKTNGILNEATNLESGCLKVRARFSLSKKAKKTTDGIKELRGRGLPLGVNTYDFESRKQIEEDIMTSLRGGDVNMIGICGIGGLGKTTMAKMIMNRALKEHVFEEVVMAVVSQPVDKLKIQDEIAGSLGLDLKGVTSEAERVQKLRERLTASTKRILLVLDDVWERLKLEEFGIPRGLKGCTILLTSRNNDTLNAMNVEKVYGMKDLSEEEAWFLFRERAGSCVDDTKLISLAKQVAEECRGLPIALITVGAALKDVNDACIWKDALQQLEQSNPADIPQIIAEVYKPLKLSYDALGSKHAKSVFLLCCLFPEDANICLKYLTCFSMGLGIFEGIRNLEEARNRMRTLIQMLKNRSLLLEGRNEDYVRMHDVVRDISIFIAKKEGYIRHNDCTWSFSSLLLLIGNPADDQFKLDDTFLEGIRELNVLSIMNYESLTSLPGTTESLRNLNTLILDSCWRLWTLSAVGKLVNLEILICRDCNSIDELPPEIKGLNRLKLLELTRCDRLRRIGPGIISSLVRLEELKMLESFKSWGIQEGQNVNAGLRELEALTNLTSLEIEIVNPAFVVEKRQLSSKLERFQISLIQPSPVWSYQQKMEDGINFEREMEDRMHSFRDRQMNEEWEGARFDKKMSVRWWGAGTHFISDWLERTECLLLIGINATNVDLAKTQNIRWLMMGMCETMKNIGRITMDGATVCPFIERLILYSLWELEEILDGPISSNSFHNVRELNLEDLPALKKLWKSSSSPVFHSLSSIRIVNCSKLEEILDGPISSNSFHNLKKLNLEWLPSLKQLWKSSYVPVFSNLSSVVISGCPHLPNLGELSISGVGCLPQLQIVRVSRCEMMKEVFLWDECDENKNNNELRNRHITKSFPNLIEVELSYLRNLAIFCQGIGGIEFPLLTEMSIQGCPKMTSMISSNENNSGATRNPDIDDDHSSHLFCQPQKMSFGSLKELRISHRNPFCGHKIPAVSSFNGLEILKIGGYHGSMSLFSPSIARDLVSLKELRISNCDELVQVIEDDEEKKGVSGGQRTFLFPKLQELKLDSLPKLVSFCEWKCDVNCRRVEIEGCSNMKIFNFGSNVSFSGLEELTISNCHGSMSLLSPSIARDLVSLKELRIRKCDELVQVIEDDEEKKAVDGGQRTFLFPKLQELKLDSLPKLVSFCEWKCDVNCRRVEIEGCSNMKIFNFGSNVSFSGLEELTISNCHGSMSLLSPSIARDLVSLKELRILKCDELVQVIEDDEEKKGVSGGQRTFLFFKLKELELYELPKLVRFCKWDCDIELSSLRQVIIVKCPMMTYFSSEQRISAIAQIQILHIKECEMMEQVFLWNEDDNRRNIDTKLTFSKLTSLHLESLPRLTSLCKGIESPEFPQLTQIKVKDCPLLMDEVFSMNLFFEPDKVKMKIWNDQPYRNAEYLSLEGNVYRNLDVREVHNMRWLIFRECSRGTKLVSVTTIDTLFPQLKGLRLVKLPELEEIWEIDGTNSFRNLKELRLEFLPSLKHLWPSQVVSIFNKLSCIYIYGCHKLCNLFSLHVTETDSYLLQLEELVIESCDMIEYVFFWNEGENQSNIHIPKLKVLILDTLPKLRSFSKGDTKIEFPLLDRKRISRCPLLENFVSTDWPSDDRSPNDHAHNIHLFCEPDNEVQEKMELKLRGNITLGRNKIQECVEYMSLEGDHSTSSDFGVGESMRCLTFRDCSMGTKLINMTTIASLCFPSIKVLTLRECSMGMELMNMTTIATPFHLLEVMCLVNITELEEIWDIDGPKNIKELRLKSLPALKHLWHSSSSSSRMNAVSIFSNLSSIYIHGCHELCNLFSLSVDTGSCVLQLENLVIESCEMMEHVFLRNKKECQRSIVFQKLKVLKLDSLMSLTSFCVGMESLEFPLLVEMRISRCPLLQNLISTDDSPIDHDYIHVFCKPDKVSFGSLKVLSTSRNPFCGHEIPASSFNGLVELSIIEYQSGMSLFSSSIARNLHNLRELDISKCDEIVKVIQDEEEEEEKVVNAVDQRTLLFPKLENLALRDLRKLEAFCEWKSDVELPSLIQVVIVRCPKMANFTSGQSQFAITGKDCISKLEILKIEECEMMEEVYLWNEEDKQSNIDTTLVFSELKSLSLKSLPRFSSLCKGIESFEFPQLTQIQVKDCPILLQNLVSINLFSKPNKVKMEKLWNSQPVRNAEYLSLEGDSSRNLDFRVVQSMRLLNFRECSTCTKLVNVATMDALFPRLEVLRLVKLIELEEIWDIDGPIWSHSFKNFKELRLEFLPKLKHLWQGSSSPSEMNVGSIFNKLSSLHVYGCHELCNLFSLAVTETGSCLVQLEELVIESCDTMEHVFFFNERESQSNIIPIPKLKVLILDSLPKLTCFCKGIESFGFPSLVQKRISRCPQLKILDSTDWSPDDIHLFCKSENKVQKKMELKLQGNITLGRNKIQECVEYMSLEGDHSTSSDFGVGESMRCLTFTEFSMRMKLMNMMTIATVFPLLEVMCLVNITELKEIWDTDGHGPKSLNELRLKSLPALKHLWQIRSSPSQMNVDIISIFNKLSCIYIYGCHTLCNLFPLSMMERGSCLSQLERLEIENCEKMEQVFLWNGENIHVEKFPELKHLSLSFLPELRNICKGIEHIQCPKLDKMNIINCPQLESLVYWNKELTFIFNSLRSSHFPRGKGANTALQPQMLKREEKLQQRRKEVEEEQRPTHRRTRTM